MIAARIRTLFEPDKCGIVIDVVGLLVAFAYGLPTTAYRFARDQAIFHYIGREWLEGRLPYRDAFDLKPPAMYAVHSLGILLFGDSQSAIRTLELFAVLGVGGLIGIALRRPGERSMGEVGLATMLVASWYYTTLDFWHTGQAEIWQACFLLGAYVFALYDPRWWRGALIAGALVLTGALFKLTAVVPGAVVGLFVGWQAWHRAAELPRPPRIARACAALGVFAAGTASILGLVVGYYAAHDALPYLWDFIGYVRSYSEAGTAADIAVAKAKEYWFGQAGWWLSLFLVSGFIGIVEAVRARDSHAVRSAVVAVMLLVAAIVSVMLQQKYFLYHWGITGPFLVLVAMFGVLRAARGRPWTGFALAGVVVLGGFLGAPSWNQNPRVNHRTYTLDYWLPWVTGDLSDQELYAVFVGEARYNYPAHEEIAAMIQARDPRPGDMLHIRGFELAMYQITGMRSPSRFVSELPLDNPDWAYHQAEWRAEHDEILWSTRPRFIVTFVDREHDMRFIEEKGYRKLGRSGLFQLMERVDG